MKKILLLLFLIIFVTGCNPAYYQKDSSGLGVPDGVHINFIQPKQNDNMDEGDTFSVILDLYNGADCDVVGEMTLRDIFGGTYSAVPEETRSFNLYAGENLQTPEIFGDYQYIGLDESDTLNVNLEAEILYFCDSLSLRPQVCVRPVKILNEGEEECKLEETISVGLKSAPITVSKIKKELSQYQTDGVRMSLDIYLKKMSVNEVDYLEGPLNINLDYGGLGEARCKNLDKFKWDKDDDTEKVINCEVLIDSIDNMIANPLTIDLDYIFYSKETLSFTVKGMDERDYI